MALPPSHCRNMAIPTFAQPVHGLSASNQNDPAGDQPRPAFLIAGSVPDFAGWWSARASPRHRRNGHPDAIVAAQRQSATGWRAPSRHDHRVARRGWMTHPSGRLRGDYLGAPATAHALRPIMARDLLQTFDLCAGGGGGRPGSPGNCRARRTQRANRRLQLHPTFVPGNKGAILVRRRLPRPEVHGLSFAGARRRRIDIGLRRLLDRLLRSRGRIHGQAKNGQPCLRGVVARPRLHELIAGDRRPATGDRRPATGDRRPATGDRPQDARDSRCCGGFRAVLRRPRSMCRCLESQPKGIRRHCASCPARPALSASAPTLLR